MPETMSENQRPNSFYDVNSLQTLGGCAMAVFISASLIRFFYFDYEHKNELCFKTNILFNAFVLFTSLILAYIRVLGPGESLLNLNIKNESLIINRKEIEKSNSKNKIYAYVIDFFENIRQNIKHYFQRFTIHVRNFMLVVLNAFLIISSAAGLSAVSGDSWFPSKKDEALILQKDTEIKEQAAFIQKDFSPKKQIADSLERKGIEAVLVPDYLQATTYFRKCDSVYNSYHSAYELQMFLKDKTGTDAKMQKMILDTILLKYNYGLPKDLKDDLREKQRELANN